MPLPDDVRTLWIYPNGDLDGQPQKWHRHGTCKRCGKCCGLAHTMGYRIGHEDASKRLKDAETIEEGFREGEPVVREDWEGHWVWWQRSEPHSQSEPCPRYLGDGVCEIYGTDEMGEICRKWPLFPDEAALMPDCGFWFTKGES